MLTYVALHSTYISIRGEVELREVVSPSAEKLRNTLGTNAKDTLVGVNNKNIISNGRLLKIEHFVRLPLINFKKDPREWWYGSGSSLPHMRRMEDDVLLCLPTSSLPAEQAYSNAKCAFSDVEYVHQTKGIYISTQSDISSEEKVF
jgi:hypothetical protein